MEFKFTFVDDLTGQFFQSLEEVLGETREPFSVAKFIPILMKKSFNVSALVMSSEITVPSHLS